MNIPAFDDIVRAHSTIGKLIHKTPIHTSQLLNKELACNVFLKCENFQKVGAFKYRGATNAVLSLSKEDALKGVCTHSSGNHAQALSLAAKMQNIPAYIVMPKTAPKVKVAAVMGYGAQVFFCEPTLQAREEKLSEIQAQYGATFIHPYDNFNVISGQGTAAKELLTDVDDLDIVMSPVGGGGLMSGTAIFTKAYDSNIRVYGAEPLNADDAKRSFDSGVFFPSNNPNTVCDGLLTSLSERTFKIILDNVDGIYTASEENIVKAMKLVYERMKIVIEPSSAVPLAAILENKEDFEGKNVGIIISGGNVDLNNLPF